MDIAEPFIGAESTFKKREAEMVKRLVNAFLPSHPSSTAIVWNSIPFYLPATRYTVRLRYTASLEFRLKPNVKPGLVVVTTNMSA